MERSDFIEALENRSSLPSQSKEDWDALADKHPYSALVQLLNYERRGTISLAEKKRLALQVDNPLHLSILTSQFSVKSEILRKENSNKPEKIVTEKKGSEDTKEKSVEEPKKKTRRRSGGGSAAAGKANAAAETNAEQADEKAVEAPKAEKSKAKAEKPAPKKDAEPKAEKKEAKSEKKEAEKETEPKQSESKTEDK